MIIHSNSINEIRHTYRNVIFAIPNDESNSRETYHLVLFTDGHFEYLRKSDFLSMHRQCEQTRDSHRASDYGFPRIEHPTICNIKAIFNRCESSDEFTSFVDYLLEAQPSLVNELLISGKDDIDVHNFYMKHLDVLFRPDEHNDQFMISVIN